ncbi:MAG: putative sugar nucleotidyl transferase [Candidatus Electryoneaceae bacterium]|nr:putative sugar nucleotidyl transferase [Candidatus Electryoneaceae bacterium]
MNTFTICIDEGENYIDFGPLTDMRAAWDLRCGAFTFAERIRMQVNQLYPSARIIYQMREYLAPLYRDIYGADNVNPDIDGDPNIIRFTPDSEKLSDLRKTVSIYTGIRARYPWELVNSAGEQIVNDIQLVNNLGMEFSSDTPDDVIVRNRGDVYLGNEIVIGPGVILDATDGPIWIAERAKIEAGAIIQGPVYIGPHSIIRPGAKLSDGVCLGPHCRVGGEVSSTIMQGYSNKQHSGYIGNSYIGSWVNLGAATDNSDLKNNYRPVTVSMNGRMIETGELHFGSIIGDHVMTAIHTRLNTGTVVGICCNLFGNDFPPKEVPPFTWVGSDGSQEYRFDKAVDTIRIVMSRRECELTPTMETILQHIFDQSSWARR